MLSLRTHIIICASLFAALVLIPMIASALAPAGVASLGPFKTAFQIFYLGLFVAFGLSIIPVMVKTVLDAQVKLGNAEKAPVAAAVKHQNRIVWVLMGLILAGSAIAVPAMLLNGGLDSGPPPATQR
ncbi:MAG TPA: hypothetical protein VGG10_22945 [Rhizomicrobium sp.]|jgi:uncharacterized membrane protein YGL010W